MCEPHHREKTDEETAAKRDALEAYAQDATVHVIRPGADGGHSAAALARQALAKHRAAAFRVTDDS